MASRFLNTAFSSLEEEIKVLKAQVKRLIKPEKRLKSFSELEGIWKGKADFSIKEIKEVKTKLKDPLP